MLGNLDENCSWGTRVSSPPAVRVIKSGFVKTIEIELWCYHWTLDKMLPSLLFAQKRTNSYVMYTSNKMGDLKQMPSLLSHFFANKKGSTWIKCTFPFDFNWTTPVHRMLDSKTRGSNPASSRSHPWMSWVKRVLQGWSRIFEKSSEDHPIWVFPKIVVITPKSSILIGVSIINHPFWGTPIFGNIHFLSLGRKPI